MVWKLPRKLMFLSNFTLLLIYSFFSNSTTVMLYPTYKNSKESDIYKDERALEAELQLSQKHAVRLYLKAIVTLFN